LKSCQDPNIKREKERKIMINLMEFVERGLVTGHLTRKTYQSFMLFLLLLKNMQYYHTPLFACFAEIHIIYSPFGGGQKLNLRKQRNIEAGSI